VVWSASHLECTSSGGSHSLFFAYVPGTFFSPFCLFESFSHFPTYFIILRFPQPLDPSVVLASLATVFPLHLSIIVFVEFTFPAFSSFADLTPSTHFSFCFPPFYFSPLDLLVPSRCSFFPSSSLFCTKSSVDPPMLERIQHCPPRFVFKTIGRFLRTSVAAFPRAVFFGWRGFSSQGLLFGLFAQGGPSYCS